MALAQPPCSPATADDIQPKPRMRSVEAARAVWTSRADITRSELLVLQVLASHADNNFECHPGFDRIAQMSRLSKRQVIRIIYKLRDKNLIAFENNMGGLAKHGGGKSHNYRLLIACKGDILKGDTTNYGGSKSDILNDNGGHFQCSNSDIFIA